MPKWFSEMEKENIRGLLLKQGEMQFARFGFKKANVDEIAAAAGISKGAFYRFYESKELLFMDIIEHVEIRGRQEILATIDLPGPTPRARLFRLLKRAFDLFSEFPILQVLTGSDFDILLKGVPTETFKEHMLSDQDFFVDLSTRCRRAGMPIQIEADEMLALIYPLVFSFLSGIGSGQQNMMGNIDMHLELIAAYCLGEVTLECQSSGRMVMSNEEGKKE